ncbi:MULTISPECIES: carbohydrate ABC transporter permease [Haloarcula]|uniref:Sugar ABC transporter permease n=1 Tax=Haloarcula pellucida TaxID=1427151 RepID=A0A830GIU8_9EURY|nr:MULTISPECIES: sugar ABC transporter permease [Halomicroarcula]MBX0348915.1 sugar ABC transporter permease [Halomicroarcula pellucida]MDS0278679.1 sugar ABC transporter permease [Halomicroarcula sp. S1AR25-4]GGN91262.1 sugar ABC transporter permease [Halomicroarcula pellucida]
MDTHETAEATTTPTEEVDWETKLRYFLNSDFVRSSPFWGIPFLVMGVAVYGGMGFNIAISLTDARGLTPPDYSPGNLDLEMYTQVLGSNAFLQATQNNLVLLVTFTTICLVLGLFLAVLIDQGIRYDDKVQTIYLLPMSLSFVVTAQLWLWMFNNNNGLLNIIVTAFGFQPVDWIGNPSIALGSIIFALIWQFSGYTMVVYLAGLRSLPDDQFEAARVDGASTAKTYLRIIIPQLKESSVSAAVVLMVFALKAFTFLYALTGRYRPPNGTDILATLMVRQAFKFGKWAYAATIATYLMVLALGVIAPYLYYQYRQGSL